MNHHEPNHIYQPNHQPVNHYLPSWCPPSYKLVYKPLWIYRYIPHSSTLDLGVIHLVRTRSRTGAPPCTIMNHHEPNHIYQPNHQPNHQPVNHYLPSWCPPSYKLVYKPHEYYRYIPLINSRYWSYTPCTNASELGHHLVPSWTIMNQTISTNQTTNQTTNQLTIIYHHGAPPVISWSIDPMNTIDISP